MTPGLARDPRAVLTKDVATLGGLIFGSLFLTVAEVDGLVAVGGNCALAGQFLHLFPLSVVAAGAPG